MKDEGPCEGRGGGGGGGGVKVPVKGGDNGGGGRRVRRTGKTEVETISTCIYTSFSRNRSL